MATNQVKLCGDFETTVTPDDVRVWASCLVEIDTGKTVFISNNIDDFFSYLENKNSVVYFHNLKFDGEFILSYLLSHGYKYSDSRNDKTFNSLISDTGVFYSITVYFKKKNKKYNKVVFYDSLKKLPFKVSVISKAFELSDSKLEIEYNTYRPVGHQLTEEEIKYIENDCKIVAGALKIQLGKGLKRITNASDALNGYKEILTKRKFEKYFPVFPVELDSDIRQAYKGGFTFLSKHFRNKNITAGVRFDVNSLYPYVMYSKLLPYGYPMYFEGEYEQDENFPLYIVKMWCEFEIKDKHIPTIQLKNNFAFVPTEYLENSNGEQVCLYLTNVDLQLMKDHYNLYNVEYECGWKFKGATGLFKDYIDYWGHIKETSTGALRQLAKLMLNSLYGKFATNPKRRKKIPILDLDGIVKYSLDDPEIDEPVYTAIGCFITAYAREKTIRSAQQVYDRFIYADTDSLHLSGCDIPECLDIHPTRLGAWKHEGTFCNSYFIRAKTYMESDTFKEKSTLKNYSVLLNKTHQIYREKDGISIDDNLKNYCLLLNKSTKIVRFNNGVYYYNDNVTCAGMPDNVKEQVTYDNFKSGSTFDGKLLPKRYKGGIVLQVTTFTIK